MADFLTELELCRYLPILHISAPHSSENWPLPHPVMTVVLRGQLIGGTALRIMPGGQQEMILLISQVKISHLNLLKVLKATMMKLIKRQLRQFMVTE